MEKKNVPQLRFKEFEDEWEEKALNNYLEVTNEKNSNNQFGKEKVLSVSGEYGVVNQIAFQGRSFAGESLINYRVSDVGTVIYTKSPLNANPYGIIKANKFEKGIVSVLYAVYKTKYSDSNFIQTYFDWDYRLNKYLRTLVNKGAKNTLLISDSEALEGNVKFPKQIEQQKIGLFLTNIDSLIQAKTQKLESLKSIKKSLLQKCFPKDGEKVPQMRFEGFSGDWEEAPLSDLLEVSTQKNKDEKFSKYDIYSVSREFGVINQIVYQGKSLAGASLVNYKIVRNRNVVYTKSPLAEQPYGIIKTNMHQDGIVSTLYGVYREKENCDSKFIQIYFDDNERLNDYLRPIINKGAKNTILVSDEEALLGSIKFPSKAEQHKIGELFDKYDSLIFAKQKEIDNLKTIKKSLLQKMFV